MANPSEKLAASLEVLKAIQDKGAVAIQSSQLTRTHRERLIKNGFIREVVKGWYIPSRPEETPGESTAWYTSFWAFCAGYLNERFGQDWCLGPEHSLGLLTGDWTVPRQVLVRSPKGGNKPLTLPYETSIFDVRLDIPSAADTKIDDDVRIFNLPAALIAVSPAHFSAHPVVMRAALAMITNASEVLGRLLQNGQSTVAGRLAGAFRDIGRNVIADDILETMRAAGYTVNETNPFQDIPPIDLNPRETSPYVNRIAMIWQKMRTDILEHFPAPPATRLVKTKYLRQIDDVYANDAYNSLSIEGYRVSAELIERVRSGDWHPDINDADRNQRDALAARGYWQAFQRVKQSIERVLDQENGGTVANNDHGAWYRELFAPSVAAGILQPADLAGYRSTPVYIRHSMHVPPNCNAVRELMPAFFSLLENEPEAAVRIVMGHFIFVYIHPYPDGNGRMGRFLMNLMFASGGYPWTVVPLNRRDEYMAALEQASVEKNIIPFTKLLANLVGADNQAQAEIQPIN